MPIVQAPGPGSDAFPLHIRHLIYRGAIILGVILGGVQVGFIAAGVTEPTWLTVTAAVFPFLAAGFGATADLHTPRTPEADEAMRLVDRARNPHPPFTPEADEYQARVARMITALGYDDKPDRSHDD